MFILKFIFIFNKFKLIEIYSINGLVIPQIVPTNIRPK